MERCHLLDGELMQLEIGEVVPLLEPAMVIERGTAHIDRDDLRGRIGVGDHRSLVRAAAGDQDVHLSLVVAVRP